MRWIVGDIHGMLRPLRALLDAVRAADAEARFFFVGDYVNRGPDSRGVIDLLLSLPDARFARGNHDDIFDLVLNGQCFDPHPQAHDPVVAFMWFIQHGLRETLQSYGQDEIDIERVIHRPTEAAIRSLVGPVPEAHRKFVRRLLPVIEEDDFFVAHAMWDPDEPDENPSIAARLGERSPTRHQILWGRYTDQILRKKRWRRTGFFGHTPVDMYPAEVRRSREMMPIFGPKIVLLDTAAALTYEGRLSAVCADNGSVIQVDRLGELISD